MQANRIHHGKEKLRQKMSCVDIFVGKDGTPIFVFKGTVTLSVTYKKRLTISVIFTYQFWCLLYRKAHILNDKQKNNLKYCNTLVLPYISKNSTKDEFSRKKLMEQSVFFLGFYRHFEGCLFSTNIKCETK